MRTKELFAALVLAALALFFVFPDGRAQTQTILVFPFENFSRNPNLDWIGESFVEVLTERLAGEGRYLFAREERLAAADRLGLPGHSNFSRATVLKIAEELDADYILLGNYRMEGTAFQVSAQVLDAKDLHLSAPRTESGRLDDLIDLQTQLAWQALRSLDPTFPLSKRAFAERFPSLRLDAFENYVRGLLAQTQAQQVRFFREAARLDPLYGPPPFQLGRIYFENKDYRTAIPWLRRITGEDPHYLEANFYLGLCYLALEEYAKAETAFALIAERLPMNEVFSNLGVAESRRGKFKEAAEHLNRAREGDPMDPDYAFNVALNAWRAREWPIARKALRDALELRPSDEQARSLLERLPSGGRVEDGDVMIGGIGTAGPPAEAAPSFERADRMKSNYDEVGFRHLLMELKNVAQRRAGDGPRSHHVALHLRRGEELFAEGKLEEARREFTDAVLLAPDSHEAHLYLGRVYELTGKTAEAIRELRASIWSKDTVAARLLLARLYLEQDRTEDAAAQVHGALALDPQNTEALGVEKTIAARRGLAAAGGTSGNQRKGP